MSGRPGAGAAQVAPPPEPADVGIVAAMSMEVEQLLGKFSKVRKFRTARHRVIEGECGGKVVALILTGMGRESARRGTRLLLDGHRPRWIISAGFGGALDPTLRRNDVVLPTEVLDDEGRRFAIDVGVPEGETRFRTGRLATIDRVLRTADDKAALRARTAAEVVDMETAAVAEVCHARNIHLLAVRVISDEAGIDLPPEILSIVGPTGGYRLGAAVGAIWRRPSSLKDLWGLREHALEAADRLAEVLPPMIAALP